MKNHASPSVIFSVNYLGKVLSVSNVNWII